MRRRSAANPPRMSSHAPRSTSSALELVRRFGADAVSFLTLESTMRHWFDGVAGGRADAVVAFNDTGKAWIAAGAPVSEVARIPRVARTFVDRAREQGRRACFFATESCEIRGLRAPASRRAACVGAGRLARHAGDPPAPARADPPAEGQGRNRASGESGRPRAGDPPALPSRVARTGMAGVAENGADGLPGRARAVPPSGRAPVLRRRAARANGRLPLRRARVRASWVAHRRRPAQPPRPQRDHGSAHRHHDARRRRQRIRHARSCAPFGPHRALASRRAFCVEPALRFRRPPKVSAAAAPIALGKRVAAVSAVRMGGGAGGRVAPRVRGGLAASLRAPLRSSRTQRTAVGAGVAAHPVDSAARPPGDLRALPTSLVSRRPSCPRGWRSTPCSPASSYGARCGPGLDDSSCPRRQQPSMRGSRFRTSWRAASDGPSPPSC